MPPLRLCSTRMVRLIHNSHLRETTAQSESLPRQVLPTQNKNHRRDDVRRLKHCLCVRSGLVLPLVLFGGLTTRAELSLTPNFSWVKTERAISGTVSTVSVASSGRGRSRLKLPLAANPERSSTVAYALPSTLASFSSACRTSYPPHWVPGCDAPNECFSVISVIICL
jgi:hypothetical protein